MSPEPMGSAGTTITIDPTPPPNPDASYLCGGRVIPLLFDRPNLYFIVDASGTMGKELPKPFGSATTLYVAARLAIVDVLRAVGHRVRYGAAVFPRTTASEEDRCRPGGEVLPTRDGDDVSYAVAGEDGPALQTLIQVLGNRIPSGPTPTAATVRSLRTPLTSLEGQTYAFLLTDGAPNCNADITCDASTCEPNLDGRCAPDGPSCCSSEFGPLASLSCVDSTATIQALGNLAADGVKTFIIGLPGSEFFADVLDALAVAGQTARPERPFYYSVEDAAALGSTLKQLAASVAIECSIELDEPPEDPGLVNVYFDETLLPQGTEDGWRWEGDKHVRILGSDCDLLQGGDVLRVQVAVGCPTVIQ